MPQIADETKAEAQSRIIKKIIILNAWRRGGVPWKIGPNGKPMRGEDGERILEYIPRGKQDFCKWTAKDHSPALHGERYASAIEFKSHYPQVETAALSELKPISRTTFDKYEDLCKLGSTEMELLEAAAANQLEIHNSASVIAARDSRIKYLDKVIASQERELVAAREDVLQWRQKYFNESALRERNDEEMQRLLADRDAQIAALVKAATKVSPIRSIPGRKQ